MSITKSIYFKNLDGLRAIAAFAVVFAHTSYWFSYPDTEFFHLLKRLMSFGGAGGRLGVVFFFILSGFLITYLMFVEREKTGKLNIIHFYIRRVLRIWPLYFATLMVGFFIYPFIVYLQTGTIPYENASFFLYSIFAANFDHIYNGYPTTNMLGVQWSVSVEEQFYLLWPLIFIFFNKRKTFTILLVVFILFSEWFSIFKATGTRGGDYHLFACIRYLSYGSLMAVFCFYQLDKVKLFLSKINKITAVLIYIVSLIVMYYQYTFIEMYPKYEYMYHIVPVIFFSYVILEQNYSENSFFKISKIPFLTSLGKVSYGIYLIHMIALNIIIGIFTKNEQFVLLKALGVALLTIALSFLSYNYLEKYFLSLKKRFSKNH